MRKTLILSSSYLLTCAPFHQGIYIFSACDHVPGFDNLVQRVIRATGSEVEEEL